MRSMLKRAFLLIGLACLGLSIAACKVIATADKGKAGQGGPNAAAVFNPDKMVDDIWDAKVVPYLAGKAGAFPDVLTQARRNPDEAGAKYGYRAKEGTAPWTVAAKIEGKIVAVETASRAGSIGIDVDGDGKADVTVQIGPAIRGTALRDSLDFVAFNDFTNQIDFARFGKSFNQHVDRTVLQGLPRDALAGHKVTVLGAFPLEQLDQPPLVTPAQVSIGPAS